MKNLFKQSRLLLIAISLLITGCATITQETQDIDNKKIYGIDCSGKAVSMDVCYKKAAQLCPSGYTVLANQAPSAFDNMPITMFLSPARVGGKLGETIPGVLKGITVKCK